MMELGEFTLSEESTSSKKTANYWLAVTIRPLKYRLGYHFKLKSSLLQNQVPSFQNYL